MAEVHNSWQDTMGEPYQIPDNPVYDASNILRPTTMTPAHADMFNEIFSRLIVNTAAVKSIADSKAGTDPAASDQDGLMFSGEPLDDQTRELLKASLQNSITIAKINAKQKFTPKKYRDKK